MNCKDGHTLQQKEIYDTHMKCINCDYEFHGNITEPVCMGLFNHKEIFYHPPTGAAENVFGELIHVITK